MHPCDITTFTLYITSTPDSMDPVETLASQTSTASASNNGEASILEVYRFLKHWLVYRVHLDAKPLLTQLLCDPRVLKNIHLKRENHIWHANRGTQLSRTQLSRMQYVNTPKINSVGPSSISSTGCSSPILRIFHKQTRRSAELDANTAWKKTIQDICWGITNIIFKIAHTFTWLSPIKRPSIYNIPLLLKTTPQR